MEKLELTETQMHILRHTAGLNRSQAPYRNHFYASEGHSDWEDLKALEGLGLMRCHAPTGTALPYHLFSITESGWKQLGFVTTPEV